MASKKDKRAVGNLASPTDSNSVAPMPEEPEFLGKEPSQNLERFRLLVEDLPHIAFTATARGEVDYLNWRWYAYTGISTQESVIESWQKVIHPDDQQQVVHAWKNAIKSGHPLEMKHRLKGGADGEYRWHITRALATRKAPGEHCLWVGTSTNIDEQVRKEEALLASNERLEALNRIGKTITSQLELTQLVQAITDITTQVSQAEFGAFFYNTTSEQGELMTLYALSGAALEAFAHFPLPRHTAIFGPTFRAEGIMRVDDITQHENFGKNPPYQGMPKGHLPVKSYLALPVVSRSGNVLGGLFFGHSQAGIFTPQVEALLEALIPQAAIAIDNAFLFEASKSDRKHLAQANEALLRSNQELVQINQELDNFVYTASHDLKAPILNIEGLLKVLERELAKSEPQAGLVRQIYKLLYESVDRFKGTIGDLTQVASIGRDSPGDVDLVSLEELLEEVIKDLYFPLQEAGGRLEADLRCKQVRFSRKNLKSILYNLLSNAIKYRSPDRVPFIRLSCQEQEAYQVLMVEDNGLGMDMSQEEKIFALFRRLHSHVEGSGIGLYMVKKMVENAGGKIEVESQIGSGSTFRVYFKQ